MPFLALRERLQAAAEYSRVWIRRATLSGMLYLHIDFFLPSWIRRTPGSLFTSRRTGFTADPPLPGQIADTEMPIEGHVDWLHLVLSPFQRYRVRSGLRATAQRHACQVFLVEKRLTCSL